MDHHLAIVSAWVDLAVAAHATDAVTLVRVRPDWELRECPEARYAPVVPDALVELRMGSKDDAVTVRFALEVDRGTEGMTELGRKLAAYRHALASPAGLFGWREVGLGFTLVDAGPPRRAAIERLVDSSWCNWWTLWDDGQGVQATLVRLRDAIGSAPRVCVADTPTSAAPLTRSPWDSPCVRGPVGLQDAADSGLVS